MFAARARVCIEVTDTLVTAVVVPPLSCLPRRHHKALRTGVGTTTVVIVQNSFGGKIKKIHYVNDTQLPNNLLAHPSNPSAIIWLTCHACVYEVDIRVCKLLETYCAVSKFVCNYIHVIENCDLLFIIYVTARNIVSVPKHALVRNFIVRYELCTIEYLDNSNCLCFRFFIITSSNIEYENMKL